MNKPTPWIGTVISILGIIGALIGFSITWSSKFSKMEERQDNDRIRYDERYIEQRESNRELKNLLQDLKTEQYRQGILIENKQNRP